MNHPTQRPRGGVEIEFRSLTSIRISLLLILLAFISTSLAAVANPTTSPDPFVSFALTSQQIPPIPPSISTLQETSKLNIIDPTDTVWFADTSIRMLIHTINFNCTNSNDCPSCWKVEYTPTGLDMASQKPQSIGLSAHNLHHSASSFTSWSQTGSLSAIGAVTAVSDSLYTISMQIIVQFRGDYDSSLDYDATIQVHSATTCPDADLSITPQQLSIPLHVDAPTTTIRKEISTYFYNTYVPTAPYYDDKSRSPKGLDPTRSHSELQISAWYNWELKPPYDPLDPAQGKPNVLDLRIYGMSYLVINATHSITPTTTICWINSFPVLVEIDTRTNQTIHIYTKPRFDMHNPKAAMSQPIPLASQDVDVFASRFFFEFTCQDRLKIVYDPTMVRNELMVLAIGHSDPTTGTITYRRDRYPQSLGALQSYVHGPTPEEIIGRAYYDSVRNIFVCSTTIDFHETAWLDDTRNNLSVVVGIDGVTYKADEEGTSSPKSAALLSILADTDTYPDINPALKQVFQQTSSPLLFVSDVSATGVQGPYISFRLPSLRPYPDTWTVTPSARIQVNIIFNVQKPIFHVKEPSCTIVMNNLRAGDARLSYSTSQYMNSTLAFDDEKNQQLLKAHQQFQQLSFLEQQQPPPLVKLTNEPPKLTSLPQQYQLSPFTTQGYDYPTNIDISTGISVTSVIFGSLKLKISNPNHVDFDFISINALPGLSRLAFTSALKNEINFMDFEASAEKGRHTLTSNGEQYLIDCYYSTDKSLKLSAGLSVFARELQIGPLHHNFLEKQSTFEIECIGVEIIPELPQAISDYAYQSESILDDHYPLDKTFTELKLTQYQHLITFYTILDNNPHSSIRDLDTPFDPFPQEFTTLQQPVQSQIFLEKLIEFSMDSPKKTYNGVIFASVFGSIALIIALLLCLPLKRYLETRRDKRRQASVKIEEVGMNNLVPFEELDEE